MNHSLVPAALVVIGIGAVWSCTGWVLDRYVNSAPASVSRWVLWSGVTVLAIGVLLYIWPVFGSFFAHPA